MSTAKRIDISRRFFLGGLAAGITMPALAQHPSTPIRPGSRLAQLPVLPHFRPYPPTTALGKGNYITISSGTDNGANNCMANHMWQPARHSNTQQAFQNAAAKIPLITGSGNIFFGGHGNEGQLETGGGQGSGDWRTQYLLTWNESYWAPHTTLVANKNYLMLYIFSCHTGAGENGADLLFQLANRLGKPAAGRTGFTYCGNGISFEANSTWQVATPGIRPIPIPAPTPHLSITMFPEKILFPIDGTMQVVDDKRISAVTITRSGLLRRAGSQATVKLDPSASAELVQALFASQPGKLPGEPFAFVTWVISLLLDGKSHEVVIYNDRLARVVGTDVAYYTTPALHELLTYFYG